MSESPIGQAVRTILDEVGSHPSTVLLRKLLVEAVRDSWYGADMAEKLTK